MGKKILSLFRAITLNTAIVLVSVIIALIIGEIVLRFTSYADLPVNPYTYPSDYFISDSDKGYDIGKNIKNKIHNLSEYPYEVFSDGFGCFDYDRPIPDHYGLVLGDSMTWGYTPLDKKWTTLLEESSGVFLHKCGVTGYGTRQELLKAKQVVKETGKNPKYIIVLYTENDLNDDALFPNRTAYGSYLASKRTTTDLITGKQFFMSDAKFLSKYNKYVEGTWQHTFFELKYHSVLYRFNMWVKPIINRKFAELKKMEKKTTSSMSSSSADVMPAKMNGVYDVIFSDHLDVTDRPWFNHAIEAHMDTLIEFADFAKSINAKFILIDSTGKLTHPRFAPLQSYFDSHSHAYYYNLKADYPNSITWKYDGHWNIQGNSVAAKFMQQHLEKINFFDMH